MFHVIFRRDGPEDTQLAVIVARNLPNLEAARDARQVSGDLVVDSSFKIVRDPSWLWEWEREDPQTYANRAIHEGKDKGYCFA